MTGGVDSGGIPFAGRQLSDPGFAGDDGRSDPDLLSALEALTRDGSAENVAATLRLLSTARVVVPVVAAPKGTPVQHHPGSGAGQPHDEHQHEGHGHEGHGHDRPSDGTEMATVTLSATDGSSKAMPVFTGVDTLAAWDPTARPSPTHVPDVARSAIEDGCDTLLVDLGSPHAAALPLSHLWALAQERPWMPPHEDPVVRLAVAEAAQGLDGLLRAGAEDGTATHGPDVLRLVLVLRPGLDQARVEQIARTMGERLAGDPEVRIRIDDLAIVLHRGDSGEPDGGDG
ncbi:SseB family protein [Mobilicoccus caccae]|uniref:SseB protein N-terminal domain-containing protein n=1 Tax=Mobilicoccus caccae TaxID=1859295 RepID=A0ABQ6IRE1_9MICO|nr:SseB family protein [Mobilicoccus caccae]GMA40011.1 hypothetical protein GCM10025883_20560 [Mobilicoccus caccae]